jgi:hypothetical protein
MVNLASKEMELSDRESLEIIEDELITLIQNSTHQGVLELLTQALMRVRASERYLEGDHFTC